MIAGAVLSIRQQLLDVFFGRKGVKAVFLWGVHSSTEVRGQRSSWPSPLCVISPVVIWLAETLASPANLISEPGGHLGQITFLLTTDWTYGEINGQSCDCEHSDCFWWLCLFCLTQPGTQLLYGNIIVLQTEEWSYCPNVINVQECICGGSGTETEKRTKLSIISLYVVVVDAWGLMPLLIPKERKRGCCDIIRSNCL